jgi:ketosteroid isomerase-like protein
MNSDKATQLLDSIQRAFEKKDLPAALSFYHDKISFANPAFPAPIQGKAALETAFSKYFDTLQVTRMSFKDVQIQDLGDGAFVISCRIEGVQTILLSGRMFNGYLSRVFVQQDGKPLIIHEHFSLMT